MLESKSSDETSSYFLEIETGVSYVKHNSKTNKVSFSENDIVNNINSDY